MTSGSLIGWTQVLVAAATALVTYFLFRVTKVLADETKRLADIGQQPHVVATLSPSPRSMIHFDLIVENTGTATAYDIKIAFDPPLTMEDNREKVPLQNISVLKPGQFMSSYLSPFGSIEKKRYQVSVSWSRKSGSSERESNSYVFDTNYFEGISRLGEDPNVEIAKELKRLREEAGRLARR